MHDLVVHPRERELVAGTHGRSVWVLDLLPVQDLTEELQTEAVHVFPVEEVKYSRGWKGRRSPWFYRPEYDPEVKIPFWAAAAGEATLEVRDDDDRVLRRLQMSVDRGVSVFTWDLLLDEPLALAAEAERIASKQSGEDNGKKKKKEKKADKKETDKTDKGVRAKTPWAEAVRLEWPLYITPGTYTLVVSSAGEESETEFEVKKPTPRSPRAKPEPEIRGRKER